MPLTTRQTDAARRRTQTPGFTLIELLTVIAVVAILSTILIPGIRYARQTANISASVSNLRQIASSLNIYATENAGLYPPGYYYNSEERRERIWTLELEPYIGGLNDSNESSRNIFVSPLSEAPVRKGNITQRVIPSTYSVHGLICANISNGDVRLPQNQIVRPSEVILVGEGSQRSNNTYASASFSVPAAFSQANSTRDLDDLIPTNSDADGVGGALRYRARGSAPVAFVDGHVDLLKKGTVRYRNIIADR